MTTPGLPDVLGLTEAGIGKTQDGSGGWLYASISTDELAGSRLRLSRHPVATGGQSDLLLDSAAAAWLLRWLCIVIYQPSQHGRWCLRLLPHPAGGLPGVPLDRTAALWLLDCLCEFLYVPLVAAEPGADAWFPALA
jgi:hypothetical protein